MNQISQVLHGKIVKDKTIAGFKLTETAYDAGLEISAHSHDFAYFCFVLSGGFIENYNERRKRSCGIFNLIFHPPQEIHSDQFLALTRCFNLQLRDSFFEQACAQYKFNEITTEFNNTSNEIAAKLYKEFCYPDELSPLIIEGLMLEMMGETIRFSKNKYKASFPKWLNLTIEFLKDRFRDNLSLSEIAIISGIHETHLAREFKRYCGSTIGDYLRRLRIEFACRRLSETDASIIEIALAAGFFDQSHFGRTFKQFTGLSPNIYRKTFSAR